MARPKAKKTTAKKAAKRSTKKTAAKKTTARKTAAKRTPVKKKAAVKRAPAKKAPVKKAKKLASSPIKAKLTKTELYTMLAEAADITKKQVSEVFDALQHTIKRCVGNNSIRRFDLPGILKITVNRKPATKARKGINPFTGEEMMFKAKPARNVVKVRALKKLKEMAEK